MDKEWVPLLLNLKLGLHKKTGSRIAIVYFEKNMSQ